MIHILFKYLKCLYVICKYFIQIILNIYDLSIASKTKLGP